jgi:hypothetical protein
MQRSTAKLKERWLELKAHWNDKASQDFEKNFLQTLPPQIILAAAAVHEFREVIEQAEKDLEGNQGS